MRKNVIFKTNSNNTYLYTESSLYCILLNPILERMFQLNLDIQSEDIDLNEEEYYRRKFIFLQKCGLTKHKEIEFVTKPNPEKIKSKLANLPQLVFEVTDKCNLKCKYCGYGDLYENYDQRKTGDIDFVKIKIAIDYLVELWNSPYNISFNNIVDISFYGGEPLVNMDAIKKTVKYLKEKEINSINFTYRMTTNAVLLNMHMDYLVENDFRILISLDGDEYANSYRITKNGKNSFQQVYKNTLLLKNKYPGFFESNIEFNAVLTDMNSYENIYSFIKGEFNKVPMVSELNDTGIRLDKLNMFEKMFKSTTEAQRSFMNENELFEDDMFSKSENVNLRSFIHGNTGNTYLSLNSLLDNCDTITHMTSGTCMSFRKKMFLTVNGKILPCEKIGQTYPLGFIDKNGIDIDFEKISEMYDSMYTPLLKLCKQCYLQDNCSQCVFNIYEKSKTFGKLHCPTFVNKKNMAIYLKMNTSYMEENSSIYEKIIETDLID